MCLLGYPHLLHEHIHTLIRLLPQILQYQLLKLFNLAHRLHPLIISIVPKVLYFHIGEGLGVEALDGLQVNDELAYVEAHLVEIGVDEEGGLLEHFGTQFEDADAGELLPYAEVLLLVVEFEVADFNQPVIYPLLLQKLLKLYKLHLLQPVLRQPSLRYNHILMWIPILKLYYLPVVGVVGCGLVHITKLLRHLAIDSTSFI